MFVFYTAILCVDDSVVDLETLEALYENVSKDGVKMWLITKVFWTQSLGSTGN